MQGLTLGSRNRECYQCLRTGAILIRVCFKTVSQDFSLVFVEDFYCGWLMRILSLQAHSLTRFSIHLWPEAQLSVQSDSRHLGFADYLVLGAFHDQRVWTLREIQLSK